MSFDGILLIDKPPDFTSFDIIAKMRGMTRTKKIGHSGTLDPMATGVLPLFFGRSAKAVDLLPNHDKTYLAHFKLGITTDTQDITGKVLSRKSHNITPDEVAAALESFTGEISQLPPMYSAVRVNGQRLYDIARSGREIERTPRRITVYEAKLVDSDEDSGVYGILVKCSRGTYIRTLCHDLGEKLGCGAAMTSLRRTMACGFFIDDCITLTKAQELNDAGTLETRLIPVSSAFAELPVLVLNNAQSKNFCCGLELGLNQFKPAPPTGARIRVCGESGRFLGLALADTNENRLKIIKLFALGEIQ